MHLNILFSSFTDWEASIVEAIQKMQNPFFDWLFPILTQLGDRYFFIVLAAIAYWIYDKKFAYKFSLAFLGSSIVTGILKVSIGRDRPYDYADTTTNRWIEPIGGTEHGKSFPSGHATSTGSISYSLFTENKERLKWLKWVLIAYMVIISFTRLYLGHHYLSDILVGLVVGIMVSLLVFKVIDMLGDNEHIWGLLLIPISAIVVIVGSTAMKNMPYDDIKDLFVVAGSLSGFVGGYFLEKKYVGYDVRSKLLHQILKVVLGLGATLLLYFGLSFIFDRIAENNLMLDLLRYLIISFFVAYVCPLVFKLVFKNEYIQKAV